MLSKTAQYAISTLLFMAKEEDGDICSASYLHQQLDIPYKYLTMIMTRLAKADIIISTRGRSGGFTLAYDPADISLTDILNAIDENVILDCILGYNECNTQTPCDLCHRWRQPREEFNTMLKTTTLANYRHEVFEHGIEQKDETVVLL